jgi:peptide/nickel transport system permease protein
MTAAIQERPSLRQWLLTDAPQSRRQAQLGRWYTDWLALRRNPLAMVGLAVVAGLLLMAAIGPSLLSASPFTNFLTERLDPPSASHWFGTDQLGRDIFVRVVYGSRITLTLIVLVSIIVLPVGLFVGTVAGYFGGWLDILLMRITDIFLALPRLVLALAIASALGPSIQNVIIAIAITSWPPYARLARAETLVTRKSDYVMAAKMQGASEARIIWSHIVPLCLPSIVVRLTLDMAGIVLISAGLGFLGMGAQPPTPEWGAMVSSGSNFIYDQFWVATMPGAAIFVVSLGFNLLGDGLRDVFDPKAAGPKA